MAKKERLHFVYEVQQIRALQARSIQDSAEIIALDYEVELELTKLGIPFTSVRDFDSPDGKREPLELTRKFAREWYRLPEFSFFSHEGIALGEQYEGPLLYYFQNLVYLTSVIEQVLLSRPEVREVRIFSTFVDVPSTADATALCKENAPVMVLELLAKRHALSCAVLHPPPSHAVKRRMSAVKRALTEYAIRGLISVSNLLVSLQPARPIRLLVTDPWSRIAPFVTAMNDVELVMTRRREVRSVGWYAWRKRIRFHRKLEYADGAILRMAHTRAHAYMREWKSIETAPFLRDFFLYGDISLWDAVRPALAAIIARAQEDIAVIESTKKIFTRNRINCVLLFASNKGYNNTVARLSEILGIPSIELQHAHELNEPSHPYARIRTQYLAAYGEMTKRACEQLPENVGKVIPCGSPRLDAHSRPVSAEVRERMRLQLRLAPGAPVLFAVVPPIYLSLEHTGFSSYYVQGMLEDFSALKRTLPDTQLILKLRPWTIRQQFYDRDETRSLFGTGTTFAQYEDIKTLLALSDVVVSGTSTVAVEAMLLHKPVLLYVPRAIDHTFEEFERAGAIVMARTREDFFAHATRLLSSKEERDRLVARADQFIKKNFLLDGTASERVAHLIRNTVAGSAIR